MNSLMSYGSDDEYDDSPEEKHIDSYAHSRSSRKQPGHSGQSRQEDVNYDEVQMSLSEDSSDESKPTRDAPKKQSREMEDPPQRHDNGRRSNSKSRDEYHSRKERRDDKYGSSRSDRDDDRSSRHRDSNREEDRTRDKYRGDKEDDRVKERRDERRGKSRERYSNRDDRYRDRKDRERKRSRSPRDRDRRRSKSPRRSRSRSKDRGGRGGYSKRYDRANSKMERLDKMDIQKSGEENKDRFFVPGITGRFREQIEKRKLLWQKKEPEKPQSVPAASQSVAPRATKVWEATTFAQDTDGKVANKFKRLMGIKNAGEGSNTASEVLKKQEEMFSSMEQQYEVARTATHTMRGVGLGFSSYQR